MYLCAFVEIVDGSGTVGKLPEEVSAEDSPLREK